MEIRFDSSEVLSDESLRTNGRMVLGYLSAEYQTDANLSVYIYYKQNHSATTWENTSAYTLDKTKYRFFRKLPNITVIDFYVKVTGTITSVCNITSLKVSIKPAPTGKHSA